jgi:hypothetical protein
MGGVLSVQGSMHRRGAAQKAVEACVMCGEARPHLRCAAGPQQEGHASHLRRLQPLGFWCQAQRFCELQQLQQLQQAGRGRDDWACGLRREQRDARDVEKRVPPALVGLCGPAHGGLPGG